MRDLEMGWIADLIELVHTSFCDDEANDLQETLVGTVRLGLYIGFDGIQRHTCSPVHHSSTCSRELTPKHGRTTNQKKRKARLNR